MGVGGPGAASAPAPTPITNAMLAQMLIQGCGRGRIRHQHRVRNQGRVVSALGRGAVHGRRDPPRTPQGHPSDTPRAHVADHLDSQLKRVRPPRVRPYLVESTTSRPICEVKQLQAQSVLRSVMTREPWVSYSRFLPSHVGPCAPVPTRI